MKDNTYISLIETCIELLEEKQKEIERLKTALKQINQEELNSQRPGGEYSKSAVISYKALKGDS